MLVLFFVLLLSDFVFAEETPPSCPENAPFCMLEMLKSWEELRMKEKNATNVLLPVMYYSKSALITLCENYSNVKDKCGLGRCHKEHPVTLFVQRHFSFVCRSEIAPKFLENQQCITSSLMTSNCTLKINEEPKIGGEIFCPKLDEFVTCVEEPLRTSCGNEAYALVMKAVEKYGCSAKIEVARVNEFLSIEMESSTPSIVVDSLTTTSKEKMEMEMLVTTSLDVEDQTTTPTKLEKKVIVTTSTGKTTSVMTTSEGTTEKPTTRTTTSEAPTKKSTSKTTTKQPEATTSEILDTTTSDVVIVDEVKESSGEIPEETTTFSGNTIDVEKERTKRKRFNAENMTDCFTSIVGDFGRFLHSSPTSSFVRLPLYAIKPMELEVLCAKYDVATECVNSFCVGNCRLPPIKSFVDAQLKVACSVRDLPDFELEFTCLQNVLKESTECVSFVNSTNPNRCDGHPQFRSCILERLLGDCSEETVKLMDRMSNGFGCKMLVEHEEEEASGETFEGSGSGETIEEEHILRESNQTDEKLLTEEIVPKTCEGIVKTSALSCLAPLLRLWTGIKENRKDTQVVFPIFEFSKIELLELCDAFANYRNCIKFTDSGVCRNEPVRKCPKVRRYTKCLRKLVNSSCGHLMLAQFDMIVHRFGC